MPENDKGRVRIMSIHKSKGLEYPIVILAGLGKKFNFQDSISKLVMHAKSASVWMRSSSDPQKVTSPIRNLLRPD